MKDRPIILVVDDEPQLTRVLRAGLSSRGYDVQIAADGMAGLKAFTDWQPDLVITDLAMPNMDGLKFCRSLREISQVPILVLSAKSEETMKVEALDSGADDFVAKPFGFDELLARIRAALRRVKEPINEVAQGVLEAGDFRIDLDSRRVSVAEQDIRFTPKEFDLMVFFVNNSGRVLTHRTLLSAIWGDNYVEQSQYLRVFIGNLRKKLESTTDSKNYIVTEPWVGYRFSPTGRDDEERGRNASL